MLRVVDPATQESLDTHVTKEGLNAANTSSLSRHCQYSRLGIGSRYEAGNENACVVAKQARKSSISNTEAKRKEKEKKDEHSSNTLHN